MSLSIAPLAYDRLQPQARLQGVVEKLWIQEAAWDPAILPSRVVPTGTVEVLFHYGDRFVHLESGCPQPVPRSYVTGQRTASVTPAPTGCTGIILASLYPWSLGRLFPGQAVDLTDGYVDLKELVDPARVEALEQQLQDAVFVAQRLLLVQDFLWELVRRSPEHRLAEAAVRLLVAGGPTTRMDAVAACLEVSPRHLRRIFLAQVGVTPKLFQRIMRFQLAMQHRDAALPWSQAAVACGYADQAHLIREVQEFTGRTPGQIVGARKEADEAFNGADVSAFFHTVYL